MLAINGEKDVQVSSERNLRAIEQALREGDNRDFKVREMEGLNHLFQTAKSGAVSEYAEIEETIAPAALEEIGHWIETHTSPRR